MTFNAVGLAEHLFVAKLTPGKALLCFKRTSDATNVIIFLLLGFILTVMVIVYISR